MNRKDAVRLDMFVRVRQFLADHAGDFPTGIVQQQAVVLNEVISEIQTLMGDQTAGLNNARFMFDSKATAREDLREMLSDINETARSMVYQYPGVDLKFRMPRNNNDADLLSAAKAFAANAVAFESNLIDFGMNSKFLGHLDNLIRAFEQKAGETGSATDSHVAATADIGETVRRGMICVRTINGAVKNKYRSDVGKLAAWLSASHVEREPQTKTPNPPVV